MLSSNNTREDFTHEHHQMVNTEIRLIIFFAAKDGEALYRILQARILEWVAMSYSRGSSQPGNRTCVSYISCIGRQVLYH